MGLFKGHTRNLAAGIAALMVMGATGTAMANLITDPSLTTGSDAIDPQNPATGKTYGQDVSLDATNSTSQATLEGLSDFAAIHSFAGFTDNASVTTVDYFDFTDGTHADIQLSLSGDYNAGSGKGNSSASFNTSPQAFYSLYGDNAAGTTTMALTIDFGTYDATASTFAAGTAPVRAAGFTVAGDQAGDLFTATFLDKNGDTLSTQTASGDDVEASPNNAIYFGLDAGAGATASTGISSIVLSFTHTGGSYQRGFDDLGFTPIITNSTVPEPATLGLLGLGGLMLLKRRRAS